MVFMTMASIFLIPLLSPFKVAFTVTLSSIMASIVVYSVTTSVFPAAGIVVSFSSGMMILFCYCAMMTNHEMKNSTSKMITMIMVSVTPLLFMMSEKEWVMNSNKIMLTLSASPMLTSAMAVIIVAMVCINKSMFSPMKSMIASY